MYTNTSDLIWDEQMSIIQSIQEQLELSGQIKGSVKAETNYNSRFLKQGSGGHSPQKL